MVGVDDNGIETEAGGRIDGGNPTVEGGLAFTAGRAVGQSPDGKVLVDDFAGAAGSGLGGSFGEPLGDRGVGDGPEECAVRGLVDGVERGGGGVVLEGVFEGVVDGIDASSGGRAVVACVFTVEVDVTVTLVEGWAVTVAVVEAELGMVVPGGDGFGVVEVGELGEEEGIAGG